MTNKKITYLTRTGRKERLIAQEDFPTEFLYGFVELRNSGCNVDLMEDIDIGMSPPFPLANRFINKFSRFLGRLPIGMVLPIFSQKYRKRINKAGTLLATTNAIGMSLAIGRMLGLVKTKVIVLAMGLLPLNSSVWQKIIYKFISKYISIITISRGEQYFLSSVLEKPIGYIPFGIDKDFWSPSDTTSSEANYVLSIGNDLARDWETLIASWKSSYPLLKIITSLPVENDRKNIEVIKGDWRTSLISDEGVRSLYRNSMFVVIPLKETIQPAGQSSCLQAMACGKAVIISNVSGLWDRDIMVEGENVLLPEPGNIKQLSLAINELLENKSLRLSLSNKARITIEEKLNTKEMALALSNYLYK